MISTPRPLRNLKALKACRAGDLVSFQARVLRVWEAGGVRMCLVGDESALTRVELGEAAVEPGRSYEFRHALVREYPGGWHSVSLLEPGALALDEEITVLQNEAYIERTYKILTGVQRKKARREGRIEPWTHPGKRTGR
ncbi:MAG: hypothetical protein HYS09_00010 [Chloroflexi bacterium]|nr:hypothetical protein [Chloroflexota bacterium]